MLETVVTPIWIYAYDGEVPGTFGYIGGAIIVSAVLSHSLLTLRAGREPADDAAEDSRREKP